jgi:succinate dehydrogenase / fumarate reductase cytochrome b subunit
MFLLAFYRSTIGKKIIMGVTGLIGIAYVIVHIAGNLQAFAGQEKINSKGVAARTTGRAYVAADRPYRPVVLHVLMAYQLMMLFARRAPGRYKKKRRRSRRLPRER